MAYSYDDLQSDYEELENAPLVSQTWWWVWYKRCKHSGTPKILIILNKYSLFWRFVF